MTDLSNPSRFPFDTVRAVVENRREVPATGAGTPPEAFESLASTQRHLHRMLTPAPTIVVDGKTFAASPGFKPVVVFR